MLVYFQCDELIGFWLLQFQNFQYKNEENIFRFVLLRFKGDIYIGLNEQFVFKAIETRKLNNLINNFLEISIYLENYFIIF